MPNTIPIFDGVWPLKRKKSNYNYNFGRRHHAVLLGLLTPRSDEELAMTLGANLPGVRRRREELVRIGFVRYSTLHHTSVSKKKVKVWELTPEGAAMAKELSPPTIPFSPQTKEPNDAV